MKQSAGFTLVEVLIASSVLTVGLLAAARVLAASTAANGASRTITTATMMAIEKMEQLRALAIDDPAFALSPLNSLVSDVDGYSDRPSPQFVRRWAIEALPSYPDDAVVVHVVVFRTGAAGRASLTTIKVRKPAAAAGGGSG